MKEKIFASIFLIIIIFIVGVGIYAIIGEKPKEQSPATTAPGDIQINQPAENMKHLITIKTNYGDIQFGTYDDDAPKTVNNFITLVEKGFYDNLTFHRVVKGFVIQGGDPNCNPSANSGPCGTGGPGYQFEDELNPQTESYKEGYKRGVVAMANSGPNTNGSQFFIVLEDTSLPHNYTIFGKVVKGQEVVDKIGNLPVNSNDKPLSSVIMEKVSIQEIK